MGSLVVSTPTDLGVSYEDENTPSTLSAPYDLSPSFEENTGDITQVVNISGFETFASGQISLVFGQDVKNTGFITESFSIPRIYNKNTHVLAGGYVDSSYSNHTIFNVNKEIKNSGFNASAFGSPRI